MFRLGRTVRMRSSSLFKVSLCEKIMIPVFSDKEMYLVGFFEKSTTTNSELY
jgi:hypothetical protein